VKTFVNTNNNTLAKSIADTNTDTAFEKYCQYQYCYICDNTSYSLLLQHRSFFPWSSINKINRMIVVEKWQNHYSLQWHDDE